LSYIERFCLKINQQKEGNKGRKEGKKEGKRRRQKKRNQFEMLV
jgi:hypothetical protein